MLDLNSIRTCSFLTVLLNRDTGKTSVPQRLKEGTKVLARNAVRRL